MAIKNTRRDLGLGIAIVAHERASMKNAAKCEIYYETQETTNHQIFERKRHWEPLLTGNYVRAP